MTTSLEPEPPSSEPDQCKIKSYFKATNDEWNSWKWQLSNTINSVHEIKNITDIQIDDFKSHLPLRITPYYLALINNNVNLQKTVIPSSLELVESRGESLDPLGEHSQEVVSGLIHRYPDRVLLLSTDVCASYCRYCTRSRLVGQEDGCGFSRERISKCLDYIRQHTEIRDVLISGGDPLTLSDSSIDWLLNNVRSIPHVEMIRIGTKVPAVLPQRITPELCNILKKYHPVWISIHFTHPAEITIESSEACIKLADSGIPLGSQTVLLKDVNDNIDTMKSLMTKLLKIRVRPYYLYSCDPIIGSSHFRTSISKGVEIIKGLRGNITGYGVPNFVVDLPGGGGKTIVAPNYIISQENDIINFVNYEGLKYQYVDQNS